MAERCVALLRGVNLGRAKRIAMADLEAAMNALDTFGLDVRTTFHEIAEATDAPKPKGFFIRRVA